MGCKGKVLNEVVKGIGVVVEWLKGGCFEVLKELGEGFMWGWWGSEWEGVEKDRGESLEMRMCCVSCGGGENDMMV